LEWNQFEKGIKKIIGELEVIKPRKPKPLIIQDAIYGPIKLDKMAVSLLENPLMQRLRLIKQLGCANFVFPSANHNRFEHSIGVYFVTCRIIEQLEKEIVKFKLEINGDTFDTLKNTMKAAAILHDIGQPPFSHVLEPFLEIAFIKRIEEGKIEPAAPHELLSKIIIEKSQYINDILDEYSVDKKWIGNFITGKPMDNKWLFAQKVINGDIDADKIDYLLRDAYFTGVPFGKIDHHRILNMFTIWDDQQAFQLAGILKGYMAFESLVISRLQMFASVYNHHTSRVASSMLRYSLSEEIGEDMRNNPSWLLYHVDASIIGRVAKLRGFRSMNRAKNKLGFNLFCRKLYKRFLKTEEEIIIKSTNVRNFMNRNKPYLNENSIRMNNEINRKIQEIQEISKSDNFSLDLPYVIIDIPKPKLFSDMDFPLRDPSDPNSLDVQQLKYVGRFLKYIPSHLPVIPWISYCFIQNKKDKNLNDKIKSQIINYFKERFNLRFWSER